MRVKIMLMFLLSSCISLTARTYQTSFPLTENPISEGGNWVNGQAQGADWSNVSTTPGFARGQEVPGYGNYNDSVALVTGVWGASQTVRTIVRKVSPEDSTINGVKKLQVTDSKPFSSGSPGIGFYLANSRHNPAPQSGYGFSSFIATDDLGEPARTASPSGK